MSANTFQTSDIAIAAFIMTKGLRLKSCHIDNSGKYFFEFEDPNNLGVQYSIDFINSECSQFDNQMKNLRKILKKL